MIRTLLRGGLWLLVPFWMAVAETPAAPSPAPTWKVSNAGIVTEPILNELSGMVRSHWDPNRLWVLNDSGNPPALYTLSLEGEMTGVLNIAGAKNVDWEELASFRLDGKNYLLIGDAGDNGGRRRDCCLYLVAEPQTIPASGNIKPLAIIPFSYDDGPKDVESIAVDVANKKILLMSKREKVVKLYELPLLMKTPAKALVARKTATLDSMPRPTDMDRDSNPFMAPYLGQVTDMNISPDGLSLVVLTYQDVFLYSRKKGEEWSVAVLRPPQVLPRHHLIQAEDICFSTDGKTIFVTCERRFSSPLLRYDLKN